MGPARTFRAPSDRFPSRRDRPRQDRRSAQSRLTGSAAMSVLTTTVGRHGARAVARRSGYRIELLADWRQAAAGWRAIEPSTPFQHPQWYDGWYGAFANTRGIVPLIAAITDTSTGERAALLPLILRKQDGIRIIEFADLDLTDYNA